MRFYQIPTNGFRPDLTRCAHARHWLGFVCLLLSAFCFPLSAFVRAQEAEPSPDPAAEDVYTPLPGDWAVSLLDEISNSSQPEARDDLLRAVMRVGPAAVPMLEPALKDDRTAEFAAQALAFIGGEKALKLLWEMIPDPRDLDLRRFYYGALAEYSVPEATDVLVMVVKRADSEPDRTVTETAIVALTVSSDPSVLPALREAMDHIEDIVIRLDLENAIEVIDRRAKQRASGELKAGGSIEYAVRGYFSPALDSPPPEEGRPARPASAKTTKSSSAAKPAPAPDINVRIRDIALFPDQTRALANVTFEDPAAYADYDIILRKQYGEWVVASVWMGERRQKTVPEPTLPVQPKATN